VAQDSAALCVKDVEDRATLAEREALEMVLRVEAKNAVVLASAHEDAKGLVRKIALLKGKLAEDAGPERWPRRIPVTCLK
jgi:hypothetical protein